MGLMAALELLREGHQVDVYERDDRIGGMSASFEFDGNKIERYYHFICRTDVHLFDLLQQLGLSDQLNWTDTRMGYFVDGQLHAWGDPMALLKFPKLDLISKLRYALHVIHAKRIKDWRHLDRRGAREWIESWTGRKVWKVMWQRAFHLKFFDYSDRVSAAWIGTRIKRLALSRRGLFRESLGYLEGGSALLLKAMADEVDRLGGRIHLSAVIERVSVRDGEVDGVLINGERRPADAVLSTAPIQYVPRMAPDLPEWFSKKIESIENIPVACVILKLINPISDKFWVNISDDRIDIPGIIEYSNLNPGPSPGAHIVYAPFYMPKTHPKWQRDNEELIDEVIGYLRLLNPDFQPSWVIARHCHRYEFAQAICPPGFFDMLPPMRTPLPGFFMADTAYYYPEDRSISESLATGKRLAREALAG